MDVQIRGSAVGCMLHAVVNFLVVAPYTLEWDSRIGISQEVGDRESIPKQRDDVAVGPRLRADKSGCAAEAFLLIKERKRQCLPYRKVVECLKKTDLLHLSSASDRWRCGGGCGGGGGNVEEAAAAREIALHRGSCAFHDLPASPSDEIAAPALIVLIGCYDSCVQSAASRLVMFFSFVSSRCCPTAQVQTPAPYISDRGVDWALLKTSSTVWRQHPRQTAKCTLRAM
ncbi:hypothetical protein EVAR_66486_1 [Eumeta japonica]|uniref:Uncharacterized protein n=1 Tax=Eumeta variegata TaxID=151549 RepID=A0A4C1ZY54_EUMVA|nr:hypothetical protein EVAR_66486_1 [Eumeta japonica]